MKDKVVKCKCTTEVEETTQGHAKEKRSAKVKDSEKNSCQTKRHHAELVQKLKLFIEPDFNSGCDFWPKMDHRLYGQIPLIIQQAIDALESAHHGKKA